MSLHRVKGRDIKIHGRLLRIARLDADKYQFLDNPEAFLSDLRNCGARIDLFTFLQGIGDRAPKYDYPMEWDNLAVIPISTFEHWWNHQIRSFARNRGRQAEKKGVTLREVAFDDALVRGIWAIYNECPVRQGKLFSKYGMELEAVRTEIATYVDSSIFIGAFLGEVLIGFAKLVTDESRTQANLMAIVSMIQHRDKAPTNALIAHAVRVCSERRIPHLAYQNFSYGKKQGDSLSHFKEINGFERFDLPRYYVPLTPLGRLGLLFGLQHKLIDRFPEPLVAKLREFRKALYNRKFRKTTEDSRTDVCPGLSDS